MSTEDGKSEGLKEAPGGVVFVAPSILARYEDYGCRVNAIVIPQLFQRYEQAGFLYAAKRQRLDPYWDKIASNWRKGCRGGN